MQIEHDPLCAEYPSSHIDWTCECDLIEKVRTDERERIATEIEALPYDMRTMKQQYRGMLTLVRASAYTKCARIALGEE